MHLYRSSHSARFKILLAAMLLLAAGYTTPALSAAQPENIVLQLNGAHSFEYAGYYAAVEMGYYAEAGLNVSLKEGQPGISSAGEVDAGHAQYGVSDSSLLLEQHHGKSVVVLAVIMQHSPYLLLARQTQTIQDIVGKKSAIAPEAIELQAYLKTEEIPLEQIPVVGGLQDPQYLIDGRIDAMSASMLFQPYYLDRANFSYQTYSPRTDSIDFYGDNLFTSTSEISKHPERVKAFRAASLRGWQYAMSHVDEVTNLIISKYSQRHPRPFYLYQAKQLQVLMRPDIVGIGNFSSGRWNAIASSYAEISLLPEKYSLEDFLYNYPKNINKNKLLIISSVSIITLISAISLYYILRIRSKLARSISKQQRAEQQEVSQSKIMELLGKDAPLNNVLDVIAASAEQSRPGAMCCINILDASGLHLHKGSAPSLPADFSNALQQLEIGVGNAACGTAAFTGQTVIVDDMPNHAYWAAHRDAVKRASLLSSWSEPIHTATGRVLGTFDMYFNESRKPDEHDLAFLTRMATISGIAMERSRSEQSIRENEKLLSDILENVRANIYMKDRQGRYLFANRLLQETFNAPRNEIIGFDDSKFYDATTAASIASNDLKVLQEEVMLSSEEAIINPLTGKTRIYLTTRIPLRHEGGAIYAICCIATDITEQKLIEERMRQMAQYDALTGLPNRALFSDRLQQSFSNSRRSHQRFGLMFIDLDKFKPVNDNFGHEVGDILLKQVAGRMKECVRQSDTVARIGGDEFVVLLGAIKDEKDAFEVGEKIRHAMNQPFEILGKTVQIGSSIGVAIYPEHGKEDKELVKHADLAMYHAKENGRNNVTIFHAGLKDSK